MKAIIELGKAKQRTTFRAKRCVHRNVVWITTGYGACGRRERDAESFGS